MTAFGFYVFNRHTKYTWCASTLRWNSKEREKKKWNLKLLDCFFHLTCHTIVVCLGKKGGEQPGKKKTHKYFQFIRKTGASKHFNFVPRWFDDRLPIQQLPQTQKPAIFKSFRNKYKRAFTLIEWMIFMPFHLNNQTYCQLFKSNCKFIASDEIEHSDCFFVK